ncbi:MAG: hypothetical protein JNK56_14510, partial [Myxococcales bacterium]|nr:hypothetical protein [Myxococcales bacterium]
MPARPRGYKRGRIPVRDPYLVRRLDHPQLGDVYLATLFASGAAFALA